MTIRTDFEDIKESARKQARADTLALDWRLWKQAEGPGMPNSRIRNEWKQAYDAEIALIVEENTRKLSILSGHYYPDIPVAPINE